MTLIDVHAHNYYTKDLVTYPKDVIVIENGVDHESNVLCLNLQKDTNINSNNTIKVALGFHPTNVLTENDYNLAIEEMTFIKKNKSKIVAIGEIGLDYYHNKTEEVKFLQKKVFIEYLKLATKLNLPVIIHARNAVDDVLDILSSENFTNKVVLHCFEASEKNILLAIKQNYFFTIPASVVRNELFQRLVKLVPVSKMLTETDAPFQGPIRGKDALSSDVIYAIDYIAKTKSLDKEEVKNIIYMNYNKVF